MLNLQQPLSSLFVPPQDFPRAVGGVLTAYSAEASFLERALVRYTGVPAESRRLRGGVDFTLMTTPTHAVFPEAAVPGLLHLRPLEAERRHAGFTVLHAKTALLGFASMPGGRPEAYRLIVGTGNWTQASARTQIEMFWTLDVRPDSLAKDRRELGAVAGFLTSLMNSFQHDESFAVVELLRNAIATAGAPIDEGAGPSFFHSWGGQSLGDILADRLEGEKDGSRPLNVLVCGSGFFDAHDTATPNALVINKFCDMLHNKAVFNKWKDKKVVTNASFDDHLMKCHRSGALGDWAVLSPAEPIPRKNALTINRDLHAKFIFLAYKHKNRLTRQRLYLGSGNLTNNGFLRSPNSKGNIEAGVLIAPHEIDDYTRLGNHLPMGNIPIPIDRDAGPPPPDDPLRRPEAEDTPAAPIICFRIMNNNRLQLMWDDAVAGSLGGVTIVFASGRTESISIEKTEISVEDVPRSLKVIWGADCSAMVPCLDSTGSFKRAPLPSMAFGDWLTQLVGYPETYDDPGGDGGDDDDNEGNGRGKAGERPEDLSATGRNFPAHTAMVLVETISEKNSRVPEMNAAAWLRYLEFMLIDNKPAEQLEAWQKLDVNFLTALSWREGFAPPWEDLGEYDALIRRVAGAWGISHCPALEKA